MRVFLEKPLGYLKTLFKITFLSVADHGAPLRKEAIHFITVGEYLKQISQKTAVYLLVI